MASSAVTPKEKRLEWDVVIDTLHALQPVIRLRAMKGWTLHSWNMFTQERGGGRIGTYTEQMTCSVWSREVPDVQP